MSTFQIVTLVASTLGIIASVMNLVAFVREKDKSHTRAGFGCLSGLLLLLAVVLLPRYAPGPSLGMVQSLPAPLQRVLYPWWESLAAPPPASDAPLPREEARPPQGGFTLEVRRNLLGGIGALMSRFTFANPTPLEVRVTAYEFRIAQRQGEPARSYARVLAEPVVLQPEGTATREVELDAEIRDQWFEREQLEPGQRGSMEIEWEAVDAEGRRVTFRAVNG